MALSTQDASKGAACDRRHATPGTTHATFGTACVPWSAMNVASERASSEREPFQSSATNRPCRALSNTCLAAMASDSGGSVTPLLFIKCAFERCVPQHLLDCNDLRLPRVGHALAQNARLQTRIIHFGPELRRHIRKCSQPCVHDSLLTRGNYAPWRGVTSAVLYTRRGGLQQAAHVQGAGRCRRGRRRARAVPAGS